jgi:hypothetical protein
MTRFWMSHDREPHMAELGRRSESASKPGPVLNSCMRRARLA